MKKVIFPVLMVAFSLSFAKYGQAGLNFVIGMPQDEFRDNIDRNGYGIGGHIAYRPNPAFCVGLALGLLTYGSESRYEPFSTTIPDVTVEVTRSNNIAQLHLILQVDAPLEYVRPYLEGRLGINYLWTETHIKDVEGQEDVVSSTNFEDMAFSYGGGGGLMVRVWKSKHAKKYAKKGKVHTVYIDLKTIYTLGGEAEYLKEGSIVINEDATVDYIVSRSRTDLLNVHIGVAMEF